jgi:cytochrome c551/c552
MKKITLIALVLTFGAGSVFADTEAGQAIFKKKGCATCHDAEKDQLGMGLGPSLKQISAAYKAGGGKDALVVFFTGKGKAIVAPNKFAVMKGQLSNTKKLSDAERGDLADFYLSH